MLTLSDSAKAMVREALGQEERSEDLALYVEVVGTRGPGYAYDLYFSEVGAAPAGASVGHDGDIAIVIPASSVERLRGSRLETSEDSGGGLVLVNPNTPAPEELHPGLDPAILALGVEGPLGSAAAAVLDSQVNPSIASHGGRADLVAADEERKIAYIKMSGGCQGCAMSRLTLTQGIEASLRAALPELTDVVDVTDHASGVNPFYAAEGAADPA